MELLVSDKILEWAINSSTYIDTCILGIGIMQTKVILDQSKTIDCFKQDFKAIEDLHTSLRERDDVPADVIATLNDLANRSKRKKV